MNVFTKSIFAGVFVIFAFTQFNNTSFCFCTDDYFPNTVFSSDRVADALFVEIIQNIFINNNEEPLDLLAQDSNSIEIYRILWIADDQPSISFRATKHKNKIILKTCVSNENYDIKKLASQQSHNEPRTSTVTTVNLNENQWKSIEHQIDKKVKLFSILDSKPLENSSKIIKKHNDIIIIEGISKPNNKGHVTICVSDISQHENELELIKLLCKHSKSVFSDKIIKYYEK